jgi:amino acid transporter
MFSRDHPLYKTYLFRGHWQPFFAWCGLIGSSAVILFSGIPSIYLLWARGHPKVTDGLKSTGMLVADLIGAYAGVSLLFLKPNENNNEKLKHVSIAYTLSRPILRT